MAGDSAHSRATALPHLEWQGELESALAEIDDRLTHPRRRASDSARPPVVPELGQAVTTELLDEIAWRVAQQIQRTGQRATAAAVTEALAHPVPQPTVVVTEPPAPSPDTTSQLWPFPSESDGRRTPPDTMLLIRFRLPVLPWPLRLFQRRRRRLPLATERPQV